MTQAKVTIRHVARQADVSVGTVSNVLNRPDSVAPATRQRVLRAITELGFVRNESARQLSTGRGRVLGLVVLDLTNPFYTDLARGVEDSASPAGFAVIVCNTDADPGKEETHLTLLEQQGVQGVLIIPSGDSVAARLRRLRDHGTAVVSLDHRTADADHCAVGVDDVRGGELAMAHLLSLGHTQVAYISSSPELAPCRERGEGARASLAQWGRDPDSMVDVRVPSLGFQNGRDAGMRLLGLYPRPTAVICTNDLIALGVLQVLTEHRVAVPDDIAIVGYDDIDFAAAAAVPLTSVRQPRRLLGRTGADLLLEEVQHVAGHRHRRVVMTPELVVRSSTTGRQARAPVAVEELESAER